MRTAIASAAALALAASAATAGSLLGDEITITFENGAEIFSETTDVVDPGEELTFGSPSTSINSVDVSATGFEFNVGAGGGFFDSPTLTLSDLDFGMELLDVEIVANGDEFFLDLELDTLTFTDASVTLSFFELGAIDEDRTYEFAFVTGPIAAVPLPASLPLLALAGLGLGAIGRRRR